MSEGLLTFDVPDNGESILTAPGHRAAIYIIFCTDGAPLRSFIAQLVVRATANRFVMTPVVSVSRITLLKLRSVAETTADRIRNMSVFMSREMVL